MNFKKIIRTLIILSLPLSSTVTLISCTTQKKTIIDIDDKNSKNNKDDQKEVKEHKERNKIDILLSLINLYLERTKKENLKNEFDQLKIDLSKIDLKKFVSEIVSPILSVITKVPVEAKEIIEKIQGNDNNLKNIITAFNGFLNGEITVLKDGIFINENPKEKWTAEYPSWLTDQKKIVEKQINAEEFEYEAYKGKLNSKKTSVDKNIKTNFDNFLKYQYWQWAEYVDSAILLGAYNEQNEYQELWHKELLKPLLNSLIKEQNVTNLKNYQFRIFSNYKDGFWGLFGDYWAEIQYRSSETETWKVFGQSGANPKNIKYKNILWERTKDKYINILKKEGKIKKFAYDYFDTKPGKTGVFESKEIEKIYKEVNSSITKINDFWATKNEKILEEQEFKDKLIKKWGSDNKAKAMEKIENKYNKENKEFLSKFINIKVKDFTSINLAAALKIENFVEIDAKTKKENINEEGIKNNFFENNNFVNVISSILSIIKVTILNKAIEDPITKLNGTDFTKIINTLKMWFNEQDFSERFISEIFPKLYPFLKDIKIKLTNVKGLSFALAVWGEYKVLSLKDLAGNGDWLLGIAKSLGILPNASLMLSKELVKLLPKINEHLNKVEPSKIGKYFDEIDIVKIVNLISEMNKKGNSLFDILKDLNNLFNIKDGNSENAIILINKLLSYLKQILANLSSLDEKYQKDFFNIIKKIIKLFIDGKNHLIIESVFIIVGPGLLKGKLYEEIIDFVNIIIKQLFKLSEKKDLTVEDFIQIYKDINKITGINHDNSSDLLSQLDKLIKDNKIQLDSNNSLDFILKILKSKLEK